MTREVVDAKISLRFDNLNVNLIRLNHNLIMSDYPEHSHGNNFYELHYIDSGKGTLSADGNEYLLEAGTLVMTGPRVSHAQHTELSDPMSEYCFEFELTESSRGKATKESELLRNTKLWVGADKQNMLRKFKLLEIESESKNVGYIKAIESIVTELLVDLVRNYNGASEHQSYNKVNLNDKRTLIIDEVFVFEYATITLDELSRRLGLSKRQTQRFLQKAYGKSFIALRTEKRREKANELIKSGMSRNQAAVEVGYESEQSLR